MEYEKCVNTAVGIGFIGDKDVRILSAQKDEIVFESPEQIEDNFLLKMQIFNIKSHDYNEFLLENCKILDVEIKPFSFIFKIRIGNIAFNLSSMYYKSIRLWYYLQSNNYENSTLDINTMEFINNAFLYPYNKDKEFFTTYSEVEKEWFKLNSPSEDYSKWARIVSNIEMAFSINNYELYKKFTECEFARAIEMCLEKLNLKNHGIFSSSFSRIYIGNEFCPNLFPKIPILKNLIEKALKENYKITVCFPYLIESAIESTKVVLFELNDWCNRNNQQIEVVINDWGMFEIVKGYNNLLPILGRLLNKRKKDQRTMWWVGFKKYRKALEENNLNSKHLLDFLNKLGVYRFEFETHAYSNKIPPGNHSLHFPFFQINTAVHCHLYARCNFKKPDLVLNCPQFCTEFCFLFPKHLKMIGRGNTIFGFNDTLFTQPDQLERYVNGGIDRLVFSPK